MKVKDLVRGRKYDVHTSDAREVLTAVYVRREKGRCFFRFPEFAGLYGSDDDGTCEMSYHDVSNRVFDYGEGLEQLPYRKVYRQTQEIAQIMAIQNGFHCESDSFHCKSGNQRILGYFSTAIDIQRHIFGHEMTDIIYAVEEECTRGFKP